MDYSVTVYSPTLLVTFTYFTCSTFPHFGWVVLHLPLTVCVFLVCCQLAANKPNQPIVGLTIKTICKEASLPLPSHDRTVAWEIADAADDPRHKLLILLEWAQKCWELRPCLPTPSGGRSCRASRLPAEVKRHRLCKWVNPRLGDSTVKSLCVLASLQHCWQKKLCREGGEEKK